MIVKNEKTGIYHMADRFGEKTVCGLDARKMEKIPSPFFEEEEDYEAWDYQNCTCSKCHRDYIPEDEN